MKWIEKEKLSNRLAEELSDEQVRKGIYRVFTGFSLISLLSISWQAVVMMKHVVPAN